MQTTLVALSLLRPCDLIVSPVESIHCSAAFETAKDDSIMVSVIPQTSNSCLLLFNNPGRNDLLVLTYRWGYVLTAYDAAKREMTDERGFHDTTNLTCPLNSDWIVLKAHSEYRLGTAMYWRGESGKYEVGREFDPAKVKRIVVKRSNSSFWIPPPRELTRWGYKVALLEFKEWKSK